MNKKIRWIVVLVILLSLLTWLLLRQKPEESRRGKGEGQRNVDALVIRTLPLLTEISVTGSLLAFDEVELKNDVAGRIVYLNLPEGKTVSKGTLLVKLFDDDLQAGLKKLKSQLSLQEQISERQSELIKIGGISQNEYEQTRLQVSTLKAEIEEQKAQIRKTEVLAPFDGIIGLRNVSVGAVVGTSAPLATIRSSRLKLDFFVPEKYGEIVRTGMDVVFSLYSGQKEYTATVFATERGIDDATRNLKVRAQIRQNTAGLQPGAFANVKLRIGENQQAILIPSEALIPMEREQQVIIARQGKAAFVKVRTGIRKEAKVEILEGLQVGDTLVTSGMLFLKEGAPLKFSHVTDPS